MSVKVSVVIPVYNAEQVLRPCLDSIIHQTLNDIEIICVDDGSSDSTPEILRQYAEKDPRVQVYTQKNQGAGAARNHGMAHAHGKYLSILDSDDVFSPEMLAVSYQRAEERRADAVVFRSRQFSGDISQSAPMPWTVKKDLLPQTDPFAGTDIERDFFGAFIGWSWDKLFRTEFLRETGLQFQNLRTSNDGFFVFCAMMKAERITVLNDELAYHRKSETSLSATREKSWDCFYHMLEGIRDQMCRWGLYERFRRDFVNYFEKFSLWHLKTMREPQHTLLYNKLRNDWIDEFGVPGYDDDYFYDLKKHAAIMRIYDMPEKRKTELESLYKELESLYKELERTKKKLNKLENSSAYRIGRIMTWLPRKLKAAGLRRNTD